MDLTTLENWLWEAACSIRGPVDAPRFKDYILPLVFLKRLSDVFDDEMARLAQEYGDQKLAEHIVEEERERGTIADGRGSVRFYIPGKARWQAIRNQGRSGLGQFLTDAVRAVARENPRLQGVIDIVDFNATAAGQRIVADEYLAVLVDVLSKYRLGLHDVEPDILGRAYEYLLRKFAEGQGQSAGEFYTPREVAILMARILEPEPGMTVYDPACGSGGLLIKCHLRLMETRGVEENGQRVLPFQLAPLRLYGQEINPSTFAIARMNAVIHDMEADIRLGDTMRNPAFKDSAGRLQTFDLVTANPMWNQKFPTELYENDPYDRFRFGVPPSSSADWGWLQHMLASLSDRGRMAVVLDTGAVSRGSGNQGSNRERDIRKAFVDADLIEAVILLPENLFYNTTAPGIILVINRRKRHPGEILLINASQLFAKGRPKNYLTDEHIATIAEIYHTWGNSVGAAHRDVGAHGNAPRSDTVGSRGVGAHGNAPIKSDVIGSRGVGAHGNAPRSDAVDVQGDVGSYGNVGAHGRAPLPPNGASATVHPYGGAPIYAIITREEAARNDYNLSPSRYVALGGTEETLPLEEAVVLLSEAEEERARADARLKEVLKTLNLVNGNAKNEPVGKPDAGVQTPVDG